MYVIVLLVLFIATLLVLCLQRKKMVEGFANFFGEDQANLFPPSLYKRDAQLEAVNKKLNEYVIKDEKLDVNTRQMNVNTVRVKDNVDVSGTADFKGGLEVGGKTTIDGGELPSDIHFIGGDLHDSGISVSKAGDLRIFVEDLPDNDLGVYFKTLDGKLTNAFVAKKNGDRFLIKMNDELGVERLRVANRYSFGAADDWLTIDGGTLSTGSLTTADMSIGKHMQTKDLTSQGPLTVSSDLVAQNIKVGKQLCIDDVCLTQDDWAHLKDPRPGPAGPPGERGNDGAAGKVGFKGLQGDRGPTGPIGLKGITGERGSVGMEGPMGPKGDKGPRGAEGPRGQIGESGPQGPTGDQGANAVSIKSIANNESEFHVELTNGNVIKLNSLMGKTIKEIGLQENNIKYTFMDNSTHTMTIPKVALAPAPVFFGDIGGTGPKGKEGNRGAAGATGERGEPGINVESVTAQPSKLVVVEGGRPRDVAFPSPLQTKYAVNTQVDNQNNLFMVWANGEKQLVTNFPRA